MYPKVLGVIAMCHLTVLQKKMQCAVPAAAKTLNRGERFAVHYETLGIATTASYDEARSGETKRDGQRASDS